MVLRSQSQAEYSPENIGHFGLNLQRYAHFTSPIRRYADLIVHRALISALGLGKDGLTPDEEERLEEISALISAAERRAMAAERDTVDRLIAGLSGRARRRNLRRPHLRASPRRDYLSNCRNMAPMVSFRCHLSTAITISTTRSARALFGERTGKGYQLADRVEVRLIEVAPLAGAMRFEMLSEPKALPGSKRSFHKAKRPRSRARAVPTASAAPRGRRR